MKLEALHKEFTARAETQDLRVQCISEGSVDAKYAIVGQSVGHNEVAKGRPFSGEAGRIMWKALRQQGFSRMDFYVTNVSKRQVSVGKRAKNPMKMEEFLKWKFLVQWELAQLPNVEKIIIMGNYALEALLGFTGITKYRGSVYEYEGRDVVCTVNPADILRNPQDEILFLSDIRTFKNVVEGDHSPPEITTHINPSFDDAMDWIRKMEVEDADVSYDIETISGETACHGLGNSFEEAMCINLRGKYENTYTEDEEIKLLLRLQSMFDKKKVIAQNGNFDAYWVAYKDLLKVNIGFDTMLAHHTLYPTLPHNLGHLTAQYTDHPFYKDELDKFKEGGDIDDFWRYNAKDVAITWECARRLKQELKDQEQDGFFYNHVMRLDKHLVRSTADGFRTDTSVQAEIAKGLKQEVDALEAQFVQMVQDRLSLPYYVPNPRSSPQLMDLFYKRFKLRSTTGAVDKETRAKLIDDIKTPQDVREIILVLNRYKEEHKFYSTYAEQKVDPDGRFRMVWKQQGVQKAPGRLSSSGNLWGTGNNVQNQPTRARKFFIADEGTVIIYGDGSQAEARIVAYVADIPKWKEDFERARLTGEYDAHRALAVDMYKLPYDQIPVEDWMIDPETGLEIPTIRYKAKRARHGLNYRMYWPRLAEAAKLSLFDAKKTYIIYHQTTPQIKEWWAEIERIAKRDRMLFTPLGRRLRILQRVDDKALESIVAFVPQATVGDLFRRVWYQCHEDDEWDDQKMRLKLNVHDSLIGLATPEKAKTALRIMKKYTDQPILIEDVYKRKVEECIIPMDLAMSTTYLGEAEKPDEYHRWSNLEKIKDITI